MKKTLILAGMLLLPLLAFADALELQLDADLCKDIKSAVTSTAYENADFGGLATEEDSVDKLKSVIRDSREWFSTDTTCKGEVVPYKAFTPIRYFNVSVIKSGLKELGYTNLSSNEELLHKIADYIVDIRPHRNDFEALLAIGVTPVEAAVKTHKSDYVRSALEKGEITYSHYYIEYVSGETCRGQYARTKEITIPAKTTREEVEALQAKYPEKVSFWQEVLDGFVAGAQQDK